LREAFYDKTCIVTFRPTQESDQRRSLSFSMHDLKRADLILVNSRADPIGLTWYSIRNRGYTSPENKQAKSRREVPVVTYNGMSCHIRMSHIDEMCHINVSHNDDICHIQKFFIIQALSVARSKTTQRIFG
jgi:hypothetical protein